MTKVPSAIWVVDTKKEHIAVDEARKLGIPVIAGARHQLRPGRGRLPDPGQRRRDPLGRAADQGRRQPPWPTGLIARSGRNRGGEDTKPEAGTVAAGEPLPEWERDLYEGAEKKADETAPAETAPAETGLR
jgi:small subunit ribosomal protein S2